MLDVLTLKEVERLINGTRELGYQTYILTCFSMGLRISEVQGIKLGDIDSERMQVHIRLSKGKKDRYVTLPALTLEALRRYCATHRHPHWLFPGGRTAEQRHLAERIIDRGGLQKSFKAIVCSVGIHKEATVCASLKWALTDSGP